MEKCYSVFAQYYIKTFNGEGAATIPVYYMHITCVSGLMLPW